MKYPLPDNHEDCCEDFNPWTILKISIIAIAIGLLIGSLSSCTRRILVTYTQPCIIHFIDTIDSQVRLYIKPAGKPRSSLVNGHHPGDTILVLNDRFIRK